MLVFPGDEENQPDAGADGGVGDVEGGKADFVSASLLQVKINEIHDGMAAGKQTVGEVAGDAAENEAEGNLAGQRVGVEMVPREKQRDEGEQRDEGQGVVVAAKLAPGCAGIDPVDEFEETINHDPLVANRELLYHQPLGELVERENHQRESGDAAIGFLENGLASGHKHSFKLQVSSFKSERSPMSRAGVCANFGLWTLG